MFDKFSAMAKIFKTTIVKPTLPVKLTIGLTYRCQSRCNYCNIWKFYQNNPEGYKNEVPSIVYLTMFEALRDNILWLDFTGGEPFLRKEIVEIVSFALNNTGIVAAGITTNGLDCDLVLNKTSEILTKSKKKQLVIGVSIDGKPEIYERARGLNGFEHAMRTFLELKRLTKSFNNLRPHIAYTFNVFNAGSFPSFYRFISEEYGISIVEVSFAIQHSFGYYFQNRLAATIRTNDEFKKLTLKDIQFILSLRQKSRINYTNPLSLARALFYDHYLRNVSTYFSNPKQQIIPCKACELSAYIDPNGYVYPCIMWNEVLGSLKKRSFKTIWASAERKKAMQDVSAGRCPNCWTPCEAQLSWIANLPFSAIKRRYH